MNKYFLSIVIYAIATLCIKAQTTVLSDTFVHNLPKNVRQITTFGERPDWSHDGKRIAFMEKTFGDAFEVEVSTGKLKPLTHHFFHNGFIRVLYLANGDYLLIGSKEFDPKSPWKSRNPANAELWVLKKDLKTPPYPLNAKVKEGAAPSRTKMKLSWGVDDIYVGEIAYINGVPSLQKIDTVVRSKDLPAPVKGWRLETQNFRPPLENELLFNAHYPSVEYEAEVMGIDLQTRKIVNYTNRPDRYDEPEGVFPDGKYMMVESTRHYPKRDSGRTTWDYIDLYKLTLDGSGNMERITFFNDKKKYKATNPVVSDDGRFMAFQYSIMGETTGVGHGVLVMDFNDNKNQQTSPNEPWQELFNGKDLKGWKTVGSTGKVFVNEGGAIECHMTSNTLEHTFATTKKKYKDFILEMDFKKDTEFNSGILFRAVPTPDTASVSLYGYQVKLDPSVSRRWTGGIFDDFGKTWSWIYPLKDDQRAMAAEKLGEWNHIRIEMINNQIKVWINNIPTANITDNKYKEAGHIAFKMHSLGGKPEQEKWHAQFKNIRIITKNPEKYSRQTNLPIVQETNKN
jgi:hypothetical protein